MAVVNDINLQDTKGQTARRQFQKISEKAVTHNLLALAAYAAGDDKRCREEGTNFRQHPAGAHFMGYSSGIALARLGPVAEPVEFLEHYEKLGIDPGLQEHILTHIKGELALSQGRTAEAARLLQEAVDNFRNDEIYYFLPASDGLALAFEQSGRPDRALPVLEEGFRRRFLEFPSDDPYEWDNPYVVFSLRIQARLALVYRQVGRIEDARKLENQLRRILAYADPDHPIVLQLKRLS